MFSGTPERTRLATAGAQASVADALRTKSGGDRVKGNIFLALLLLLLVRNYRSCSG